MSENIIIEQGVANEFKSNMQKTYDFLNDCNNSIDNCKILTELGFDGGNNTAYTNSVNNTKSEITTLLSQVMRCEEDLINLDEDGSERIATIFENEEVKPVEDTSQVDNTIPSSNEEQDNNERESNNNHNSGGGGGNYYPSVSPVVNTPVDTDTQTDNAIYKFSTDRDTAYNQGDIFIDDYDNSLTKFTNDLLEKYNIKDENVAKKIYEQVINYGKEYYSKNNSNPIKEENADVIMNYLYEKLGYLVNNSTKDTFWDLLKDVRI